MADMDEAPETYTGSSRFHFDPDHDPSTVPTLDQMAEWARGRFMADGSQMAHAIGTLRGGPALNPRLIDRLRANLPFLSRGARKREEARCLALAIEQLRPVHEAMREFAVDLTTHRTIAPMLDGLGAMAVLAISEERVRRFYEDNRHRGGDDLAQIRVLLEQMDTGPRIARYTSDIRTILENEAMVNLLSNEGLQQDPLRCLAALRAARDEVIQPDVLKVLEDVIERAGRKRGR